MKPLVVLTLLLAALAGGTVSAAAQAFDFGGFGFGLLGGGPSLGSSSSEAGAATSSGAAAGAREASSIDLSGPIGEAAQSLTGSDILSVPPEVVRGQPSSRAEPR